MAFTPTRERMIMPVWSNSTVLHLNDSIAIAIAQSYLLARGRLLSHPSPVFRAWIVADHATLEARLLERELLVFHT